MCQNQIPLFISQKLQQPLGQSIRLYLFYSHGKINPDPNMNTYLTTMPYLIICIHIVGTPYCTYKTSIGWMS